MSWIISFQIPLEVSLGNLELLNFRFFYNSEVINEMVAFSALVLDVFLLGVTVNYSRLKKNAALPLISQDSVSSVTTKYSPKPLFILMAVCFLVFLLNINKGYIDSGHGTVKFEGIGFSFLGVFLRLSIIYLSIIIYNNQEKILTRKNSIKSFLKLFDKPYLVFLVIIMVIFFLAHNRVFVILTITPFVFAFFLFVRKKISSITVILIFLGVSVFGTLFKLYGIENILSSSLKINDNYVISKSYFPFTAELGGSVYAQSILYYKWYTTDFSLYGASYLVGVIRTFPGLMNVFSLKPISYDTAVIGTLESGVTYGVGTTSIMDILINFGFILSLFIFFGIGYFFSKMESKVYKNQVNIYTLVIYFSITSFIMFIPRASMNDVLGAVLFNIFFVKIYSLLYLKKIRL
ncbi:hypothetical protein DRF67_03840 [Chryseobacterium pennipullorum]|uniref:Oligosaccharide repeat unit polymerase n=2 Tax=Chryseobacterium pennipullorum TaxID=2258963 RepID=A0A3D9B8B8_9FLAO|nr:hypothetical protein DRF67_03840 [Chryseobacterium pennipullorum]